MSFIMNGGLTVWLSGSGETGETLHIIAPFLANRAGFERQSRCPTGAGVGHGLEDSIFCCRKTSRHNKRFFIIQARQTTNQKTKPSRKTAGKERQPKPKRLAQNKKHKVKNFAYTASKPGLQKSDGLQTDLAKTPAKKSRNKIDKVFGQKKRKQASDHC
jgi:hypothetical protein